MIRGISGEKKAGTKAGFGNTNLALTNSKNTFFKHNVPTLWTSIIGIKCGTITCDVPVHNNPVCSSCPSYRQLHKQ